MHSVGQKHRPAMVVFSTILIRSADPRRCSARSRDSIQAPPRSRIGGENNHTVLVPGTATTRLDRTVAIKILPEHLSSSPQAKQRFDREARAISSLNHPSICTLHDIGRQDGLDFLVLELLEGETLEQRLVKGPLSLEHTIGYSVQIADALAKAHKLGITHRDLKPANILLTNSGATLIDL